MSEKQKILWHSNAPWSPTGYGNQTQLFAPLVARRWDLAISAFYGLEGSRITYDGIPVMPGLGGEFGNQVLVEHARHHFGGDPRGGLVFTLMDVWVLSVRMAQQLNMVSWVPVDHEPAPPNVVGFFRGSGTVPMAMSRFGERMLTDAGLEPLYVPHGVDTDVMRPHSRSVVRRETGVPEHAFLVGMVAANKGRPSRKGFTQALQAFAAFRQTHNDAVLYLHTVLDPGHATGEDLPAIIRALGIPSEAVLTADQYRMMLDPFAPSSMAKIFSSMDVLLNPAAGEGFGIPIMEAQACGTPAIVTNFSAMTEVCGAGWHVGCRTIWTGQNSWQVTADVEEIVAALEQAHNMPEADMERLRRSARKHALGYDVLTVAEEHLLPALEEAHRRFEDRAPTTMVPA